MPSHEGVNIDWTLVYIEMEIFQAIIFASDVIKRVVPAFFHISILDHDIQVQAVKQEGLRAY